MLGFQGYEPLEEVGVYDEVRQAGRPIAPRPDQPPVAVAVRFGALIEALQRDLPMVNEHTVTELLRDGDRVVGVVAEGPDGATTEFEADLVVACDGMRSPVRDMAGLEVELRHAARGRARLHEPVGGRHLVRHELHVGRRPHRDALLERGLGRLAQRRARRP